ncbi:hypothetical protein [Methylobacter tundripaludum]|uniref:hypothetical protein n=1 Tax=Methylobacter tundripaludum TaxID=173365 RepID=UPI000486CE63|nr:hypothetical protein [Methylobacter tundripaludum]
MIRFDRCYCPKCGKEHDATGRLGTAQQCSCGTWIPNTVLDRVRYYWIFQVAISYGVASFFLALALFYRDLPSDPWDRFFSPMLQVPAAVSFIVSYRILVRHKRTHDSDDLMFRYFLWSIVLMSIGLVATFLLALSNRL